MLGYLDNPELTADSFDGEYFKTGDLARMRPDDRVELVGRAKDIVSRGGIKIAPLEIDNLLCEHPAVAAALCAGDTRRTTGRNDPCRDRAACRRNGGRSGTACVPARRAPSASKSRTPFIFVTRCQPDRPARPIAAPSLGFPIKRVSYCAAWRSRAAAIVCSLDAGLRAACLTGRGSGNGTSSLTVISAAGSGAASNAGADAPWWCAAQTAERAASLRWRQTPPTAYPAAPGVRLAERRARS